MRVYQWVLRRVQGAVVSSRGGIGGKADCGVVENVQFVEGTLASGTVDDVTVV